MRKCTAFVLSPLLIGNAVLAATYPLATLSEGKSSGLMNLSADTTK